MARKLRNKTIPPATRDQLLRQRKGLALLKREQESKTEAGHRANPSLGPVDAEEVKKEAE